MAELQLLATGIIILIILFVIAFFYLRFRNRQIAKNIPPGLVEELDTTERRFEEEYNGKKDNKIQDIKSAIEGNGQDQRGLRQPSEGIQKSSEYNDSVERKKTSKRRGDISTTTSDKSKRRFRFSN